MKFFVDKGDDTKEVAVDLTIESFGIEFSATLKDMKL